ncbi:HEAT repeat domain-containing protein [Schlesneria sp. T3-172]|uniref:HEAT repeat domain-containing protein n=1 Tax=Schlesneria sphaerica TaxID=3373610 RepID=UPI0037CABD3B
MSRRTCVILSLVALIVGSALVLLLVFVVDSPIKRQLVHARIKKLVRAAKEDPLNACYPNELLVIAQSKYSFAATNAVVGLGEIGNSASIVLVPLAELLKSPDDFVSREAARALSRLGPLSAPVLGELKDVVKNGRADVDTTWFAAEAIGNIGPTAREALPLLRAKIGKSKILDRILLESIRKLE